MEKLQWNNNLSIGVKLIDEQHKLWIERFNDLSGAIEAMESPAQLVKTLDFLVDYTSFHFSTEEKQMEKNNYPDFEEHKKKHEELKKTLNHLVDDFEEEGASQELANYVNTFLGNWLINHIKEVDLKLGKFFQEKGIIVTGIKLVSSEQ